MQLKKYEKEFLTSILKEMMLIRSFEDKCAAVYGLKKINGFLHLCTGQEAISAGGFRPLDLKRDYVITGYRDHGMAISCGIEPGRVMAELYGKKHGVVGGRGGSMHMFSKEHHLLGGHGIVGAQIGIGTGSGFTSKYKKESGEINDYFVTLTYFGDGAINQGIFHESLNMAAIYNLPVLYILENNKYAMGTSTKRSHALKEDFSKSAEAYGIEYTKIDGMNVIAIYEETKKIVDKMRVDGKPRFMEIDAYRYKGHSASDPQTYRTREEIEEVRKKRDCIKLFSEALVKEGILNESEIENIKEQSKSEADAAADFAENDEEPEDGSLMDHVLVWGVYERDNYKRSLKWGIKRRT